MKTVAASPALYFIMLRHRTLSPTIYLSEVTHKPFALSQTFFLSSGGKSAILVKKKAPSRSGFPLSTHVALKTRHANPNIHVRRFIVHVRSPNLSTTRPQLLSLRGAATYYGFAPHTNSYLHSSPAEARLKNNATLGRQSRGWQTNSAYYYHKVRARKAESPIVYSSSTASCTASQSKLIIFSSCLAHSDCLHFSLEPPSIISPMMRSFRLPFCTIFL